MLLNKLKKKYPILKIFHTELFNIKNYKYQNIWNTGKSILRGKWNLKITGN